MRVVGGDGRFCILRIHRGGTREGALVPLFLPRRLGGRGVRLGAVGGTVGVDVTS
jgi:hypothetical protein